MRQSRSSRPDLLAASGLFLLAPFLAAEAQAQTSPDSAAPPPIFVPTIPPAPPSPPLPPAQRGIPTLAPALPRWPPRQKLRQRIAPDWSDYRTYPEEARLLNQEGTVIAELLVDRTGTPKACRILTSSGYAELDAGSCAVMMKVRYDAPRDARGRPTEASIATRLLWVLAEEPRSFVPSGFEARLVLSEGAVVSCELTGYGPFLREWAKTACRIMVQAPDYYLGDHLKSARRASIFVDLMPAGTATPNHAAPGRRLVASRRTEFELKRNGDPANCRSPVNRGFGKPRADHGSACGYFMSSPWFEDADDRDAPPRTGAMEINVFVER